MTVLKWEFFKLAFELLGIELKGKSWCLVWKPRAKLQINVNLLTLPSKKNGKQRVRFEKKAIPKGTLQSPLLLDSPGQS